MLDASIQQSGRSLTGEIVFQLERAFQSEARITAAEERNSRLLTEIVRAQQLIMGLDEKFAARVRAFEEMAPEIYRKRAEQSSQAAGDVMPIGSSKKVAAAKPRAKAKK